MEANVSLVTRRAIGDAAMSVGALCALFVLLVSFNAPLREEVSRRIGAGRPAVQAANMESTVRNIASVLFVAARDQSIEHAPLVLFVLAAIVLFMFMLRT
jgi:hypothetical protein